MLRIIVFVCGAALMGLEMVAARLLAPALGNSIYVWGAVISSVLIALSLGYWLGGHGADRLGAARLLPLMIAGAAVATMLVPPVARLVMPYVAEMGARTGSLVASVVVFFVPALLLATVSPIAVRIATHDVEHVGRSAGTLYAISTAGSVVGTVGTSFWLVPLLAVEPLIVWIGFLLALACLLALGFAAYVKRTAPSAYAPAEDIGPIARRFAAATSVYAVAGVLVAATALGTWGLASARTLEERNAFGETVLFRADTQYHRITVTEDATARHLRFDRGRQSAIRLDDPLRSDTRYNDYLHLTLAVKPDAKRVLLLGLGGGTMATQLHHDHPEMLIDAVEIDPVVIDVAERYFGLPRSERTRVFEDDARRYVQRTPETYDIVIIDAYHADSIPAHLTTLEFFSEVDAVLAEDGVIAYNIISAVEGDGSKLFRSMRRTALEVWDEVWAFPVGLGSRGDAEQRRNIIVIATDARLSPAALAARIEQLDASGEISTVADFAEMAADLHTGVVRMADVPILTDAHAPTDSLIDVR